MNLQRYGVFLLLVLSVSIFLLGYTFRLMFVYGKKYDDLSDSNRVRKQFIEAKRGAIKDRYGEVLVQDTVDFEGKFSRKYEVGEAFGHVLGYMGSREGNKLICAKNESQKSGAQFQLSQSVEGVGGVEEFAECSLRGMEGVAYVEVNSQEKSNKKLESIPAKDGDDVTLTVDANLQKKAYEAFMGIPGAAIVMEAKSSNILALVSAPSFDPSKMGKDSGVTEKYLKDPKQPLFNRSTLGIYPPGSVFKMVVASAGLQEGKISPSDKVVDTGYRVVGGKKYTNWLYTEYGGRTDGEVDMVKSLKRSNDIYYYELASRLGPDLIAKYAHMYGFGAKTGIEIQDSEGVVPSAFWKEEKIGDKWFLGDTYNYGIGQGYLLVTPLQVAVMTQIVANDGNYCAPTIISDNSSFTENRQKRSCKKINVDKEYFEIIKKGMEEACSTKGTAWTFFDMNSPTEATAPAEFKRYKNPIKVGCKTGTAEHYVKGNEEPHGWLTLFAPANDPQIIITVLAEKGGQGSDSAGPIARRILDSASNLGIVR
ncbi:MAG: penicillin-binding transpeptidase domain-containing protein [Patescibacteria group bacterium]